MLLQFSRILLVDDSATIRKLVRAMLAELGRQNVDEAGDGREALGLIARRRYAVVISDWIMEPMSGLELLTKLRRSPEHKDLPFIMMTSQAQIKYSEVARDAGATHFLAKPFNVKALGSKFAAMGQKALTHQPLIVPGSRRRLAG